MADDPSVSKNKGGDDKFMLRDKTEALNDFIGRLSHELRNPLNVIIGYAEQLRKSAPDERSGEYIDIINISANHLLHMLSDLLAFSRFRSGQLRLDEVDFDLASLIREIYHAHHISAERKKINFNCIIDDDCRKVYRGDPHRIRQLISNLVTNAIKFTRFGYVELRVSCSERRGGKKLMRCTVKDTGIGIPADRIGRLFKEQQPAGTDTLMNYKGAGIGLMICKQLADLMGGELSAESTEGRGSVFTALIPLHESKHDIITENNVFYGMKELSGKSVLMIDDDRMNLLLGRAILEGFDMKADIIEDGPEAFEMLKKKHYDIVLLDIHMRPLSGLEIARYIRNKLKVPGLKIIAATADIVNADIEMLGREGVDEILIKPYREIRLYEKLCSVLNIRHDQVMSDLTDVKQFGFNALPEYDLSDLRRVTDKNEKYFYDMINTFIETSSERLGKIRAAYGQNDWKEVAEISHRMIPSFKHLGIRGVASDLIELEHYASGKQEAKKIGRLITEIEKQTDEVVRSLKDERP